MMRNVSYIVAMSLLLVASGCATPQKPYAGHSATTPESQRVVLKCDGWCGVIENVDTGTKIDARSKWGFVSGEETGDVSLDPGSYRIEYLHHIDGLVDTTRVFYTWSVKLQAGHTYTVNTKYLPAVSNSFHALYMAWLVDNSTGATVAGIPARS